MFNKIIFWQPAYKRWRSSWGHRLNNRWIRTWAYLDMYLVDHAILRLFFTNFRPLNQGAYCANQPTPRQLARYVKKLGIQTVVNLRGPSNFGSYHLEKEACAKLGISLIDFRLYSREMPTLTKIKQAQELFNSIQYPVLFHCKSGADRAGIGSALYLLLRCQAPIAEAKQQLSFRHLHVRYSKTGLLDHFLDSYEAFNEKQPIAFLDWAEQHYDKEALSKAFMSRGWANLLIDRILRRE